MRRRGSLALLSLVVIPVVLAYPNEYRPFAPGKAPRRFTLHDCERIAPSPGEGEAERYQYAPGARAGLKARPVLQLEWKDDHCQMAILDADGQTLAGPVPVADQSGMHIAKYADLNHDDRQDFVVEIPSMGCGLAGEYNHIALAISDGKTYRITALLTMSPGPEDFVDIDGDGRCEIVHSAFIYNDAADEPDRRPHNYRVYNLLEIQQGQLQVSRKDRRFPYWIWYTFKANHTPTRRLSAQLKARLWKEQGQVFWKPTERAPATQPSAR